LIECFTDAVGVSGLVFFPETCHMRALRIIKTVEPDGMIRLQALPFRHGQTVEIIVLPAGDEMADLALASESSLGFWENDTDDRVWNDAVRPA